MGRPVQHSTCRAETYLPAAASRPASPLVMESGKLQRRPWCPSYQVCKPRIPSSVNRIPLCASVSFKLIDLIGVFVVLTSLVLSSRFCFCFCWSFLLATDLFWDVSFLTTFPLFVFFFFFFFWWCFLRSYLSKNHHCCLHRYPKNIRCRRFWVSQSLPFSSKIGRIR